LAEDNGAHTTRHKLNKLVSRHVKNPAATTVEVVEPEATKVEAVEPAPPLSVIDVTEHQANDVSSLRVEGVENLAVEANKKAACPKVSTRVNAVKDNTRNEECKVEIARAYQKEMNKVKAAGKEQVSRGYLTNLIRQKKSENGIPKADYISD
jgi:hypothetical protein